MKIYLSTFPNEYKQRIELNEMDYIYILASYYFCRDYDFIEYSQDLRKL